MVQVIAPQKHETVLDPACGTAGFLISDYKYILKHNENLTPDERARLMTNFCGYDIAPDMVRLSRVNLYLHGFPNPVIHEYDTLTSEERWDERYDVIMANPPFMSPKGGIRPHNRFSIKANRSELLFVDYIAEHLNPGGRAGIIVPEGIIFQGQNAYKNLRRMLVENYLWAVVSLPAGVFNPYSGVKTSILFLDRNLARRTDAVLFVKIENDGFDLGAQRRPIEQNDLPEALKAIVTWKNDRKVVEGTIALAVSRKRILESPDVSLSGDRYRPIAVRSNSEWPMVSIGEICELQNGRAFKPTDWEKAGSGGLPIIRIQNLNNPMAEFNYFSGTVDERLIVRHGDLLFSWSGSRGTSFGPHIWNGSNGILNQHIFKVGHKTTANRRFLYWMLKEAVEEVEENLHGGVGLVHITKGNLERITIPLPPVAEQERLVVELEGYRKVIEAARQILASYKPTLRLYPKWPVVKLGELCSITAPMVDPSNGKFSSLPHVSAENMESGTGRLLPIRTAAEDRVTSSNYLFEAGSVLYSKIRPYLCKAALVDFRGVCSADMYPLDANHKKMLPEFLLRLLLTEEFTRYADNCSRRARMPKLNREQLFAYETVLPPLATQREIVAELEAERALVEANRELIARFEQKLQAKLSAIWEGE
jgi:type I restriction enzyme M protein